MKDQLMTQITHYMQGLSLNEMSEQTGIQITRIHRLRKGAKMDVDELFKFIDMFGIKIQAVEDGHTPVMASSLVAAIDLRLEQAEHKVASHHGVSVEMLRWTLGNPTLKKA